MSTNSKVSTQDLQEVLDVLYSGHKKYKLTAQSTTTFFTFEEIQHLEYLLSMPLPNNLSATLLQGVRQGAFLRCFQTSIRCNVARFGKTGGTLPPLLCENGDGKATDPSAVPTYAFNPQMLNMNAINYKLIIRNNCINCQKMYNTINAYSTSDPNWPVSGYSGQIYGIGSGPDCVSSGGYQSSSCCRNTETI